MGIYHIMMPTTLLHGQVLRNIKKLLQEWREVELFIKIHLIFK